MLLPKLFYTNGTAFGNIPLGDRKCLKDDVLPMERRVRARNVLLKSPKACTVRSISFYCIVYWTFCIADDCLPLESSNIIQILLIYYVCNQNFQVMTVHIWTDPVAVDVW